MTDRFVELVALGPELRMQAESRGKSVTEAHYLVHQILAQAFADLHRIPSGTLREHMASELERKLEPDAVARRPRTRTGVLRARRAFERLPDVWRLVAARANERVEPAYGTC